MQSALRRAMHRFISLAALLALACSGPAPAENDSGIGFELPDAAPSDAGAPDAELDSGPPDAGDGLCADLSRLPLSTPGLPPECLPRCTSETRAAVLACSDVACDRAARAADPTPPARFRTTYGILTVTCGEAVSAYPCHIWQLYSCFELYCRTEFYDYSDCLNAGGTCTAEQDVMLECMGTMPEAIECQRDRVAACYAVAP